jgi:hypothetical protein
LGGAHKFNIHLLFYLEKDCSETFMDFKDCIKFGNENPVSYVATVEGNQIWIKLETQTSQTCYRLLVCG